MTTHLGLVLATLLALAARPALGATWQPSPTGASEVFVLAVDPGDPAHVWAGTDAGLLASLDGGASWQPSGKGLPPDLHCAPTSLAVDTRHPRTVWVGTGIRLDSAGGCGVFRSTNGGRRWRAAGLPTDAVGALAATPSPNGTVYAGTTGDGTEFAGNLLRHRRGRQWDTVFPGDDVDLDIAAIVVDPSTPSTVYAATNHAGLVKSTDRGAHWTSINTDLPTVDGGLPGGHFVVTYALAIDATHPETLYTSTLGVGSCCIDLIGGAANVFRSDDGGASWAPATSGLENMNVLAVVVDPVRSGVVYAGGTAGVFASTDHGDTWSALGTGVEGKLVASLAIDPSGTTLHAGTLGDGAFRLALE